MKNKVGVVIVITLFIILSVSIFATAESGRGRSGSSDDDSSDDPDDHEETEIEIEQEDESGKQKIKIKSKSNQRTTEIESEVEVEIEDERGEQKIKVKSKGDSKTVGVSPEIASAVAAEIFGDQSSVVLKELNNKVVYVAQSETDGKFLGLFKIKVKQEAEIDSETGEVTAIKKKGWSRFFVFSRQGNQTFVGNKTTICHKPLSNSSGITLSVGTPAVKAHLKHGDYLGACNQTGNNSMNNTGNQTMNNTNMTANISILINSPMSATYNMTEILFNITSNGNWTFFSINGGAMETYTLPVIKNLSEGNHTVWAVTNNSLGQSANVSVIFSIMLPTNMTDQNSTNSTL